MTFFLFGLSATMGLAYCATGEQWFLLPQWTALISGFTVLIHETFELLEE